MSSFVPEYNLSFRRGFTWGPATFAYTDDTKIPITLIGTTLSWLITVGDSSLTLTLGSGLTEIDLSQGKFSAILTSDQTLAFPAGSGRNIFTLTDSVGNPYEWISGSVIVHG